MPANNSRTRARRTPAGKTADPCPLCKKSPGEHYEDGTSVPYRGKDSLCTHCLHEIKNLRDTVRRLQRLVKSGRIENAFPRRVYPYPRPHRGATRTSDAVGSALVAVVRLMGGDADEDEWFANRRTVNKSASLFEAETMAATFYRSFTDAEYAALQNLYEAIQANASSAYEEGRARGKDLLLSLQAGDIALSEFHED